MVLDTAWFTDPVVRGIGLVLFALGISLFITAMVTMKDSWRAGIPSEDKTAMISSGIYSFSRNPAFLGYDLTFLGTCPAFGNITLFIITAITMIMMHLQILDLFRHGKVWYSKLDYVKIADIEDYYDEENGQYQELVK